MKYSLLSHVFTRDSFHYTVSSMRPETFSDALNALFSSYNYAQQIEAFAE
jgi:hypothetical protein